MQEIWKDIAGYEGLYQVSNHGIVNRWDCISDAARFYGVNAGNISNCLTGRNKSYKGYIWRYAGE